MGKISNLLHCFWVLIKKMYQSSNYTITLIMLCGAPFVVTSQIQVTHTTGVINTVAEIFNLEVTHNSGNPIMIKMTVELRQNNRLLFQGETNAYNLIQPVAVLNENLLQPIQVQRNELEKLAGDYTLDVKIWDQQTKQMLVADRLILKSGNNISDAGQKKSSPFAFSGTANLYGQFSDRQGVGSEIPQNFVRAEINPNLTIKDIPLGLDILWSTEQNAMKQSINQVAFRFDAQQFKKQLEAKAAQKVKFLQDFGNPEELTKIASLKDQAIAKKFPDYKKWEQQLADPNFKDGMDAIKNYDALSQVINHPEVSKTLARKKELESVSALSESQILELEQLKAYASEMDKITSKANELKSLADKYRKYENTAQNINKAKKFASSGVLKDPAFLKNSLKSFDLMSKAQNFLSGFDAITLGTSYPFYSRFSLSAIPVNGLNIVWDPGKVYLALSYGKSSRQTINIAFALPLLTLSQNVLASKFGYGSPYGSHLHLTFLQISDRFDELALSSLTKAQSNRVIGTSGQINFLSNKITLGGELMTSLLTRDKTIVSTESGEFAKRDIPLSGLMGSVNSSSSFDVAWKMFGEAKVFGNNTRIRGNVERIGANYYTLGSPALLNGLMRWKADVSQSFLKNQIRLSAFARQDANNLDTLLITSRSTTKSYGLTASFQMKNLPSLVLSFAPYAQNNELAANNTSLNTNATMTNISLNYPVSITKGIQSNTQLTFMGQNLTSDIVAIDYNLKMYSLAQSLIYKGSSVNLSLNYTPNQVINNANQSVTTMNLSASTLLLKKWQNMVQWQYLSIKNADHKTGFNWTSSYPVTTFANLELRLTKNIYQTISDINNFDEWIMWTGVRLNW